MSSKRKSEPTKKSVKRNKSKVEDDYESDLSDDGQNNAIVTEVLLQPHEEMEMLPEPLLKTFDKEPGRLLIAGMVTWDMTGRKTSAKGVMKIRPNLYTFHRFTTDMVKTKTTKGRIRILVKTSIFKILRHGLFFTKYECKMVNHFFPFM